LGIIKIRKEKNRL